MRRKKIVQFEIVKAVVPLSGVHCAACVARIEGALSELSGVKEAHVNLASATLFITYDTALISQKNIKTKIEECGFGVLAFYQDAAQAGRVAFEEIKKTSVSYFYRFIISLALTAALIIGKYAGFSDYTFICISFLTWAIAGWSFHIGCLRAIKAKTSDMNTLVSMSTTVIFLYGIFAVLFPGLADDYKPHWSELGVLICFINFGRWLETKYKVKAADALEKLFKIAPRFARKITAAGEEIVPLSDIKKGDTLIIRPGEQVPVDGKVIKGLSTVDESLLTGETLPVNKAAGSLVYSGTFNQSGWFEFIAQEVGENTTLMQIAKAVQESQAGKSSVQRVADKISAWFVPSVLLIALVAGVSWFLLYPEPSKSISVFAAVLAVSCPCAMGLAVPIAVSVGFGRAASLGVLIKNTDILDNVSNVSVVIFDKTGTITDGSLSVLKISPFGTDRKNLLMLMAAAEDKSEHPFAQAVRVEALKENIVPHGILSFSSYPGRGVKTVIKDGEILVGSLKWLLSKKINIPSDVQSETEESSDGVLLLAFNGEYKGYATFGSKMREDARYVVEALKKMGIEPVIASGDRKAAVEAVAGRLGIKNYHFGVFPEDKRSIIRRYKALGKKTVMVGDGFNDASALSSANIGIAMRSGTDMAAEAGDITLMRNDLKSVLSAINIVKHIKKVINQNMAWAFMYNVILIPITAGVLYPHFGILVQPHWAGAAMALSSVSVVLNSLRLKKIKI